MLHPTQAAGLTTAAHHTDDRDPVRGLAIGIGISAIAWLGLSTIVAAVVP